MIGITNQLIMAAATKRGWKVTLVSEPLGLVRYTDSKGGIHYSQSALTSATNSWQILVAKNKDLLYSLANEWDLNIPITTYYENPDQAKHFLNAHKRIVIKPKNGAHGNGITTDITTGGELAPAIELAQEVSDQVLLQEYIPGSDYRLLIIGGECKAIAIREPATVTGDGEHDVKQLIELENSKPDRGENYQTRLNKIDLKSAERFLGEMFNDKPKDGERVQVIGPANIGTGGSSRDVTGVTPPPIIELAAKVVEKMHLGLAGIDVIYNPQSGPKLIEINSNPSFGLHMLPQEGTPQPVADHFLDWLEQSSVDSN